MAAFIRKARLALAIAAGITWSAEAADLAPTEAERAFSGIELRHGGRDDVQHAAYRDLPLAGSTAAAPAATVHPAAYSPISPASTGPAMTVPSGGPPISEAWVIPDIPASRPSTWTAGLELLALDSHLTRFALGPWEDDETFGSRLVLGYEGDTGSGIRLRLWGIGADASPPADDVELNTGALDLDFGKRLLIDDTELLLGAGFAGRGMKFTLSDGSHTEFRGGGVSLFAETSYPLWQFPRTDVRFVGRGRWTLTRGDWRDTTGIIVAPTDDDNMSITEAALGLEMRRRFGWRNERFWSLALMTEYQRWESQWMSAFTASAVGFSGVSVNFGVGW